MTDAEKLQRDIDVLWEATRHDLDDMVKARDLAARKQAFDAHRAHGEQLLELLEARDRMKQAGPP